MTKTVHFLHLDDEVIRISWIPNCLRTVYFQKNRHLFKNAQPVNQEGLEWTFAIPADGDREDIEVVYSVFETVSKLLDASGERLKSGIIILDLMGPNDKGTAQILRGVEAWEGLKAKGVETKRIFMLTAFKGSVPENLQKELGDRLLEKPIDAGDLAPRLLIAAGILNDE